MNDIIDTIGLPAVLEQLAEECSELAQASLKYARLLRGENPTPKTERECLEALTEEMADVELCNSILMIAGHVNSDTVMDTIDVKERRWHERLEKAEEKPSAQPDTTTHDSIPAETGKNDGDGTSGDCISRRQAIDKFIDALEEIFSDIREKHVDDSVCGLCEYDGAYIGQSGDWCNECPGFDRDDCFKLSDKTRKKWTDEIIKAFPSIQPERKTGRWIEDAETYYKAVNEKGGGVNENTPYFTDCIACSECLSMFSVIDNETERFDFCPNCGAKMEDERKE